MFQPIRVDHTDFFAEWLLKPEGDEERTSLSFWYDSDSETRIENKKLEYPSWMDWYNVKYLRICLG
jgi:hypothetical protein